MLNFRKSINLNALTFVFQYNRIEININPFIDTLKYERSTLHLSFFYEIQTELGNLPNLPNSVKIKMYLNVSKFKMKAFISFLNALNLYFELSLRYLV